MTSLYKLKEDYDVVLNMLDDPDADEQAIIDTCDAIEGAIEDKADSYAFIISDINADIEAIKAEESRLAKRRRTLTNRIDTLKNILEAAMRATGRLKFKTALHSFGIQKNGGKAPLDVYGEVPTEFTKTITEPDNEAIRAALEEGKQLNFACLQERGESLRIR